MSALEQKAAALDAFLSGAVIADHRDLEPYIQPEEAAKLRSAGDYVAEILQRMDLGTKLIGLPTPWRTNKGKVLFKPHEFSVWTGYKGHAKTMVLSQCMCNGMSLGEKVLVISPEFRPPTIIERKLRQCATVDNFSRKYVELWSQWANGKLWFYDHQGSVNAKYVLAAIRYAREKFGITQVVIDSLMKMGIATSADGYDKQKWFVDSLQSIAHDTGVHVHLVAHARKGSSDGEVPGIHDVKGTSEICDMAENVYVVWTNKKKLDEVEEGNFKRIDEPDVIFKVEAQRNVEWRGITSLWMHKQSFQFIDAPDNAPQIYLSDNHVEF